MRIRGSIVGAALIVLVCLAAVFLLSVQPTAGQAAGYRAARLAGTAHPDVSGIWQAVNTAHYDVEPHAARAALAMVQGPLNEVPAAPVLALGAIGGVPAGMGVIDGEDGIPYRPDAALKKKENFENSLTRDPEIKCYLPGVPRAMYMPYPFQIIQSGEKILMVFEYASASRTIHLDQVPAAPAPSWMGHSVGKWEGDSLVVTVTDQLEDTWFDRSGNFHSDALRVTERYTPTGPDHLEYQATIEDPKVFTRPWTIRMPLYRRKEPGIQVLEYKCVEFVEELMYGHLRKEQLVKEWRGDYGEFGGRMTINVARAR